MEEVIKRRPGRPIGSKAKVKEEPAKVEGEEAPKASRGRPELICDEIVGNIVQGVQLGMTFGDSAIKAGISPNTYNAWMIKGKKDPECLTPYGVMRKAVKKAVEDAKGAQLLLINRHAAGGQKITKVVTKTDKEGNILEIITTVEQSMPNLRASQWMLERRFPKEFGPRQEVAVTNGDNPFNVSLLGAVLMGSGEKKEDDDE